MADRTLAQIIAALEADVYGKDMRTDIVDLATKIDAIVTDAVEHQLIEVDATLTQSGQGADAAVTGSRITAVQNSIPAVDDALSISGAAADAAATGAALGNKANYYNPTFSGKLNQNGVGTLGYCATALGCECKAGAPISISAGNECETKSTAGASVALGDHTVTHAPCQLACGSYNEEDANDDYLVIVGNGDENARSNAATVGTDGSVWFAGNVKVGGAGYSDSDAKELATKDYVDDGLSGKADISSIPSVPIISTDISQDALSEDKTVCPKAVKTYVDNSINTNTGTYTLGNHVASSSNLTIKQIGNIVYITGSLTMEAGYTFNDIGGSLFTITSGVPVPTNFTGIPIVTRDSAQSNYDWHSGAVGVYQLGTSDKTTTAFQGNTSDDRCYVNGFYFVNN